jgi:hypothetical protein
VLGAIVNEAPSCAGGTPGSDGIGTTNEPPHAVAFVDSRIANYLGLSDLIDVHVQDVFLDPNQDSVQQLAEWLEDRRGIDAVHTIARGSEASIGLVSAQLASSTLPPYEHLLDRIGSALSDNADILIYGMTSRAA